MKQCFFLTLLALTITQAIADQQRLGLWLAGNGDGAPLRSVVELVIEGEHMFGRIERVIDQHGAEVSVTCDDCPGEMRGKPMKGLVFISGLRRNQGRWIGGRVVNLEPGFLRGIEANCEITFKGESVEFFGYKGIRLFGNRVTWPPYK